jgi:hypothetical protein
MSDWPFSVEQGVPSPALVSAWAWLNMLPAKKIPLWAAYWIAEGHDGERLVHLAGLHGDDPCDVRDTLPGALEDCGVILPDSDVAAAAVVFGELARLHLCGLATPLWVVQRAEQVLYQSGYSDSVLALPLGQLYGIADEWGAGWGRTNDQLAAIIREACEEQLRGDCQHRSTGTAGKAPRLSNSNAERTA